jgi:hypothetical protein
MSRVLPDNNVSAVLDALPNCCYRVGFTYIVGGADKYKIGRAENVQVRVRTLQTGSPVVLRLAYVMRGDLEAQLHRLCRDGRVFGEWFDIEHVKQKLEPHFQVIHRDKVCIHCADERLNDEHYVVKLTLENEITDNMPSIEWEDCRDPSCLGLMCWFTSDGRVQSDFYGRTNYSKSLALAAKGTLKEKRRVWEIYKNNRGQFRMPEFTGEHIYDELLECYKPGIQAKWMWRAGCLYCAAKRGEVSYDRNYTAVDKAAYHIRKYEQYLKQVFTDTKKLEELY